MAAASDKARYFLESYVPELQELSQKKIFTRDEISSITTQRSDFEHILNARGSTPADYARYATYEMNLDALKKKRCKRLKVKTVEYSGARTVFFILERGTKKFPGNLGLWMQYVDFCRREKANKKLARVFTQVLRLKPREYGLWVLAAKYYAETQNDMATARGYLQRGLRFCMNKRELWLEFGKLEMVYLAKLAARRKILGLDEEEGQGKEEEQEEDGDGDFVKLPTVTAEDMDVDDNQTIEKVDATALEKLSKAPAFTGAIPLAIFDAAMKNFKNDPQVAEEFFDMIFQFDRIPASDNILSYILDYLQTTAPNSPEAIICESRTSLYDVEARSAEFPAALAMALPIITSGTKKVAPKDQSLLGEKAMLLLLPYLRFYDDLDEGVVKVLEASLNRYIKLVNKPAKSKAVRLLVEKGRSTRLTAEEAVHTASLQ